MVGTTTRVNNVEVIKPPITTIASGREMNTPPPVTVDATDLLVQASHALLAALDRVADARA